MRIGINGRVLSDAVLRGWNRYTIQLLRELVELRFNPYVYSDRELDPVQAALLPMPSLNIRIAPRMNYLAWEQGWLPRATLRDNLDLFHSPIHFDLSMVSRIPCVLTLHDNIDEIMDTSAGPRTLNQRITSGLCFIARRRADHILTVSDFSRDSLVQHFKLSPDRISVTYGAADNRFHVPVPQADKNRIRRKYQIFHRYLFYVGSLEPRKNIPFLLAAMVQANLPELHFVLGGGSMADCDRIWLEVSRLGLQERVHMIGRVDEADLPALYSEAEALVYPSIFEGFGLQLAEAMAVGCPVLASRCTCFPEIVADGGDLFSVDSPVELVTQLRRLWNDDGYRDDLRSRSYLRGKCFSWAQTARQTVSAYQKLLGKKRITPKNGTIQLGAKRAVEELPAAAPEL